MTSGLLILILPISQNFEAQNEAMYLRVLGKVNHILQNKNTCLLSTDGFHSLVFAVRSSSSYLYQNPFMDWMAQKGLYSRIQRPRAEATICLLVRDLGCRPGEGWGWVLPKGLPMQLTLAFSLGNLSQPLYVSRHSGVKPGC